MVQKNMIYLMVFLGLFGIIKTYFFIARLYRIYDVPNARSSHKDEIIRGGGIIFSIAIIFYWLLFDNSGVLFLTGLIILSTTSFLDDRYNLPSYARFAVQLISITMMVIELNLTYPWTIILVLLAMAFVNAYNFMDGINGLTVLYTFSVFIPLFIFNANYEFVNSELFYIVSISLLIFGYYNVRTHAACFSGDVGSISLGYLISFLLIQAYLASGEWSILILVCVYGVDSGMTILKRIIARKNIFKAHREHVYQGIVNELGGSHLSVSLGYGLVQLVVSAIWLTSLSLIPSYLDLMSILIILTLAFVYLIVQNRIAVVNTMSNFKT